MVVAAADVGAAVASVNTVAAFAAVVVDSEKLEQRQRVL